MTPSEYAEIFRRAAESPTRITPAEFQALSAVDRAMLLDHWDALADAVAALVERMIAQRGAAA